ncbi:MAG: preprotein translocase subunit SecG [Lachnospiraceae bacterium]|nr:preprotein translocase subunit SecG [Lachnospiraceae bacterium]
MEVLRYILCGIFALGGLFIIFTVLMQEGKSAGLGTIGGMGDTYWEKNKARSREGKLEKATKIAVTAFFVLAFLLCINF